MKTQENRAKGLEQKAPTEERQFIGWAGNPWTPEQRAAAILANPNTRVFWRSLGEEGHWSSVIGSLGEADWMRNEHCEQKDVVLDYGPHAAQMEIHRARDKRFRVVCTGRRFGKTLCLAAELLDRGGCEKGGDYGWVAPTYSVAERAIENFRSMGNGFVQVCGHAPCRVEFQGRDGLQRTRIWFLSADNPDNMRGFGFQGLVIDEAAVIPQNVWHYVLRPTISQTLGWAVLVSTPMGRNWFYDLFTRGLDPAETDYRSFTYPSNASPFFPAQEWEEARRKYPVDAFRQEYMAEFMEDGAGVFRGIDACLLPQMDADGRGLGQEANRVVIGCDLAKHTDWTVLIAMDAETGRCFAMDRFNQLEWPIQKERIVAFARKWRGKVIMDATGVGDPIYDDLKRVLPDIEPYVLTVGKKVDLVQQLRVAVEQRQVSWPGTATRSQKTEVRSQNGESCPQINADWRRLDAVNWEMLTTEMKRYEYEISPSGGLRYGAPGGYHDDCVIALALANHGRCEKPPEPGNMYVIGGGRNRTPSDGGYESEGDGRWRPGRFRRRSRVLLA